MRKRGRDTAIMSPRVLYLNNTLVYYSNITNATHTLCYKINPGVRVSILHIRLTLVNIAYFKTNILLSMTNYMDGLHLSWTIMQ